MFLLKHLLIVSTLFYSTSLFSQFSQIAQIWHSCGSSSGGAQIEILEGIESDYYYVWPHDGRESLYHDDLPPGEYLFYIENRFGCKEEILVLIENIESCFAKATVEYNQKDCVYEASVTFGAIGVTDFDQSYIVVEWNYQGLTGAEIEFEFPDTNADQFQLCFDYYQESINGTNCCSGTECITVFRDPAERFCNLTAPCKLVINEVVRRGDRSFVEFVVVAEGEENCESGCNLVGTIIDDNNGALIKDAYPLDELLSGGIDKGYIKLSDAPSWEKVPVGSRVVIYENKQNPEWTPDPADQNGDGEYYVWIKNTEFIQGFTTGFSNDLEAYEYNGFPTGSSWSYIEYDRGFEGLQTRLDQSNSTHAIATGGSAIMSLHGEGVIPLPYSYSPQNEMSIRLMNNEYKLPGSYSVVTGSGNYTPGQGNSVENTHFIQTLISGCKDSAKSEKASTSSTESKVGYINIAPNPFNQNVQATVSFPSNTPFTLRIMDAGGNVLQEVNIGAYEEDATLEVGELLRSRPAGIYLISAIDAAGRQLSAKVVKSK